MRTLCKSTLTLTLLVAQITPAVARAATLYVGPCSEFDTIQEAVDVAVDGDSVLVAAGTYKESVAWEEKGISVIGLGGSNETMVKGVPEQTNLFYVVHSDSGNLIQGFTLCPLDGRGIGSSFSSVTVRDVVVSGWRLAGSGYAFPGWSAGLNHSGYDLTLEDSRFSGAVITLNSTPEDPFIENCVFINNGHAFRPLAAAEGGALGITGNSRIRGNWFEGNFSNKGAAIYVYGFHMDTDTRILNNVFLNNTAVAAEGHERWNPGKKGGWGGAIYADWPLNGVTISNNLFVRNRGAGVVHLLGPLQATHNLFFDNEGIDHEGWPPDTTHDLHADPLFFDPAQGEYVPTINPSLSHDFMTPLMGGAPKRVLGCGASSAPAPPPSTPATHPRRSASAIPTAPASISAPTPSISARPSCSTSSRAAARSSPVPPSSSTCWPPISKTIPAASISTSPSAPPATPSRSSSPAAANARCAPAAPGRAPWSSPSPTTPFPAPTACA